MASMRAGDSKVNLLSEVCESGAKREHCAVRSVKLVQLQLLQPQQQCGCERLSYVLSMLMKVRVPLLASIS